VRKTRALFPDAFATMSDGCSHLTWAAMTAEANGRAVREIEST